MKMTRLYFLPNNEELYWLGGFNILFFIIHKTIMGILTFTDPGYLPPRVDKPKIEMPGIVFRQG